MNTFDTMTPGSAAIILFGVAFLGGAIGSFLNVVIYRLPAGLSLIHPPSRCPKCEHPIRSYDNIPVLGWILLRGKCRDCGQPISPRYPTIEAIVSLMFLVVAWLEWFGPRYGVGLPGSTLQMEPLVARAGLHVVLLTTMLGAGMIEWDGVRAPAKMWVPFILISIISWAFFPDTAIWQAWDYRRTIMAGLINGLVGAAVGLAVGEAFALFDRLRDKKKEPVQHHGPLLFGTLGIGLVFGWQVIVGIGMFYLPILLGEILLQRASVVKRILPHGLALFVLTLLGIVALCFMPFQPSSLFDAYRNAIM